METLWNITVNMKDGSTREMSYLADIPDEIKHMHEYIARVMEKYKCKSILIEKVEGE